MSTRSSMGNTDGSAVEWTGRQTMWTQVSAGGWVSKYNGGSLAKFSSENFFVFAFHWSRKQGHHLKVTTGEKYYGFQKRSSRWMGNTEWLPGNIQDPLEIHGYDLKWNQSARLYFYIQSCSADQMQARSRQRWAEPGLQLCWEWQSKRRGGTFRWARGNLSSFSKDREEREEHEEQWRCSKTSEWKVPMGPEGSLESGY